MKVVVVFSFEVGGLFPVFHRMLPAVPWVLHKCGWCFHISLMFRISFSDLLQTLARNDRKYVETQNGVEGKPIEPRVQQMAFNADGSVLATIGLRPLPRVDDGFQTRLSFWDRTASGSEPYEINTSIDEPHRYAAYLSLCVLCVQECAAYLLLTINNLHA